jgi:hypothetical protein
MMFRIRQPIVSKRFLLSLTIALSFIFFSVSVASAALTTINTNNNSNTEWSSVPVFMEDPTGDLNPESNSNCADGNNTVDLVKVYVASGPSGGTPTALYFMAQMAGANALSGQNHAVSAYIDCSGDFDHTDPKNSNAIYVGASSNGEFGLAGDGEWPQPNNWAFLGANVGERPANALTNVEWQIDFDTITGNPTGSNCTANSVAHIAFTVAKLDSSFSYVCSYDVTSSAAFNVPTLLTMRSLTARNDPGKPILSIIGLASVVAAVSFAFISYHTFQKEKKGSS